MSAAILAALAKFGPWLLGLAGLLFGAFRHQQAKADKARAAQQVAEADKRAAVNDAANAQANAIGAQAGADNLKVKQDEMVAAAGVPDANRVLHDTWGK